MEMARDTERHTAMVDYMKGKLEAGYMNRTRSLAELNRRFRPMGSDLQTIIADRLAATSRCSVLELGFGWGRVLVELASIFRKDAVSLNGVNLERQPPVEGSRDLVAVAEALDLVAAEELGSFRPPQVAFHDASTLQFPDESFDLVYSVASIRFIEDKARVIEEVARVLCPGGRALLELGERNWRYPAGPAADPVLLTSVPCRMVLHHDLELVPLEEYLAWVGGDGFDIRTARHRCSLELRKKAQGSLALGLNLDHERTLPMSLFAEAHPRSRCGVRSAYTVSDAAFERLRALRQGVDC